MMQEVANGIFNSAGTDWDNVRCQPAPDIMHKAAEAEEDVGEDWSLRSLAEALPVRYEYDINTSLPDLGKCKDQRP